jgi:ferredoxin
MTLTVLIDQAACAAHGDCVDVAPQVFALDEIAEVVGTGPDDLLMAAAEACPSAAIVVLDADSHQQLYP